MYIFRNTLTNLIASIEGGEIWRQKQQLMEILTSLK